MTTEEIIARAKPWRTLETRVRELEDRIIDLEAMLRWRTLEVGRWIKLGLSAQQAQIMNLIMAADVIDAYSIAEAIYGDPQPLYGVDNIRVQVCHIKRKLDRHGITVETLHGYGHWLTPEMKQKIKEAL